MKRYDFTVELIQKIKNLYVKDELSCPTIGKMLGIGEWAVWNCLKKNGIKTRTKFAFSRKYELDETFFEKIDDEKKAYFLGYLYADGAIYKSKHGSYFHLTLQERDKHILESFKKMLKTNIGLRRRQGKGQDILMINSKKMVEDLIKLGCMPNKSFKINFPTFEIIPEKLMPHFIRGYFDGDGSISWNPKNYRVAAKIISNVDFCDAMQHFLSHQCKISKFYVNKVFETKAGNQFYTNIEFGGYENIKKFYNYIYKKSSVFLSRKKEVFESYLKYKNT
jgi:DNA-binding transcriptional regulator WhiA